MKSRTVPGENFNRLTAICQVEGSTWKWLCDCGNEVESTTYSVRCGNRKSCGCLRLEKLTIINASKKKPNNEACKNTLFFGLKAAAKRRGLLFELSRNEVDCITQQNCYYCGTEPANTQRVRFNDDELKYNGLDRIDSLGHYENGNVVPCCKLCNQAKNDLTTKEFFNLVTRIYNNCCKESSNEEN